MTICAPCRIGGRVLAIAPELAKHEHEQCPELARQRSGLTPTELAGSALCECQHDLRSVTRGRASA